MQGLPMQEIQLYHTQFQNETVIRNAVWSCYQETLPNSVARQSLTSVHFQNPL